MYQQQQNYQTASYRGNQFGHDNSLRADSQQPSFVQSQYRGGAAQTKFQPTGTVQSFYQATTPTAMSNPFQAGFQNQPYQAAPAYGQSQFVSAETFHTANYRGNQPGHDNYLRADATNPSAIGQGAWSAGIGAAQSAWQTGGMAQTSPFGAGAQVTSAYQASNYRGVQSGSAVGAGIGTVTSQYQAQNPASYHTANYVGNQPGHDNAWRADSTQPSYIGQQYGIK